MNEANLAGLAWSLCFGGVNSEISPSSMLSWLSLCSLSAFGATSEMFLGSTSLATIEDVGAELELNKDEALVDSALESTINSVRADIVIEATANPLLPVPCTRMPRQESETLSS